MCFKKTQLNGNILEGVRLLNVVVCNVIDILSSAVTYTDSLIGHLLKELRTLGIDKETIVSFWGDHGWQLGE